MTGNSKCFLDSNIWIYSFIESQDPEKHNQALKLINELKPRLCLSAQVVNEICINLIRKAGVEEARINQLIVRFYFDYEIIETNQTIILKASDIRSKHDFSFWDSMLLASALEANADNFYSEDMQDGFVLDNKLKIINPFISN